MVKKTKKSKNQDQLHTAEEDKLRGGVNCLRNPDAGISRSTIVLESQGPPTIHLVLRANIANSCPRTHISFFVLMPEFLAGISLVKKKKKKKTL